MGGQMDRQRDRWREGRTHRSLVKLYFSVGEIGELFEGVDRDQNRANVGLTGVKGQGSVVI